MQALLIPCLAVVMLLACEASPQSVNGEPFARPKEVTLQSPYRNVRFALKGQLHGHTTKSDGHQKPYDFVAAYARAHYDFIAVSDHDVATPNPRVPGIIFLHGMENEDNCHHETRVATSPLERGAAHPQLVVDQAHRAGAFVQINHPDWPGRFPVDPCWSDAELLAVSGYDALEAWNANTSRFGEPSGEARADMLLTAGRRFNLTAVDDCHDVRDPTCMTHAVIALVDKKSPAAILAALKSGNFYASRGGYITSIATNGRTITVRLPADSDVEFIVRDGRVAARQRNVTNAAYEAHGDEIYVRVSVTQSFGNMAWSNPIYVNAR